MSAGAGSSPDQPSEENAAQPTPGLQPGEALSTGPSQAIPGLVAPWKLSCNRYVLFEATTLVIIYRQQYKANTEALNYILRSLLTHAYYPIQRLTDS